MEQLEIVSAIVVAISAVLIAWHVLEWRGLQAAEPGEIMPENREREFAWRRFRRRTQASGIIGLVGAMMFASQWIHDPLAAAYYWMAVLFLLLWLMMLAVGDAISSRNFFRAEYRRQVAEQLRFQSEVLNKHGLRDFQAADGADGGE